MRVDDTGSGLNVYISYNSKLFAPETIRNIADIYAEALDRAVSGSGMKIGELTLSGRSVGHVSGEIPEGLRTAEADIAESGRLHTDAADICLVDSLGRPVPAGFYGRVLVDENGVWQETGKTGYINNEDRLVISESRTYLMKKGDTLYDLDELRERLSGQYPDADVSLSAYGGRLVFMYDGAKVAGDGMQALMKDADIVMDTKRMRQKNTLDFVSAAAKAMDELEATGCSVRFEQKEYNSGDIIIIGSSADEAAIRDIAERSGTEKLGFRMEAGGGCDCALYITKEVSKRTSEINDMWIDITQNSSCGCFEDFYESEGLKIYDLMLALNSRYGLKLKIFDMFRMGTPAKIADFIDQNKGLE